MSEKTQKYFEGIGRRKTAIARVRITPASKSSFKVNDKALSDYFKTASLQKIVQEVFNTEEIGGKYSVSVKVSGGGQNAQAEAVRLGIARALIIENLEVRKPLKKKGYLKRDARVVERKKFGLKKARKRPAWSKR